MELIPKASMLQANLYYKIPDIFVVDFERSFLLSLKSPPQSQKFYSFNL
jgi:hypothetical protein